MDAKFLNLIFTDDVDIPPSSGLPISKIRFSPSIVVDTLLPKNFDFGRSSPRMATLFSGEM